MYGEQPPSYPGMDALMAAGNMALPAGGAVAGGGAVVADGDKKKKKKKKTLKKRNSDLAQSVQEGNLEEVSVFVCRSKL